MSPCIFDFNGTLFQDSIMHYRAWKHFMSLHDVSITEEQFRQYMCGPSNDSILRRFLGTDLTDLQLASLASEKETLYREQVTSDPSLQELTPGATEMLDSLKARGIPFAIATGSSWENVSFYLNTLHIDRWFDPSNIFYAEGTLPGKPDPAIYRMAMEKMGFEPSETIVVEDAFPGIASAVAAGVQRIIAIDTTLGPSAFKGFPMVKMVIHDFHNYEKWIDI